MASRIQGITVEIGGDSDRKRKNAGCGCKPHSCPTLGRSQPIAKQSQFGGKSRQWGSLRGRVGKAGREQEIKLPVWLESSLLRKRSQ